MGCNYLLDHLVGAGAQCRRQCCCSSACAISAISFLVMALPKELKFSATATTAPAPPMRSTLEGGWKSEMWLPSARQPGRFAARALWRQRTSLRTASRGAHLIMTAVLTL